MTGGQTSSPAGVGITVSTPPTSLLNDPVGGRLLASGHFPQAVEYYRKELNRNPRNVSACVGLGTAYCKMKNLEPAFKTFQECLSRMPEAAELYFGRGMCEQEAGGKWLTAAEADYKKTLALKPNHAGAHNQLGILYLAAGQIDPAIAEFQAAITAEPRFIVAYNNLGASLIAAKRYSEAIAILQKAILMTSDLRGLYLYTNLGIAFLYAGKPAHAEAAFLMETAINPNHLEAHLNLGNLYVISRRYQEAIYEYYRVLMMAPNHREALINLGAVYVIIGKPAKALEFLEKAVQLYPDSALAHHYLALAYRAVGKENEAREHEKKAYELGYRPETPAWPPMSSP